jgi:general secretion pathway protein J
MKRREAGFTLIELLVAVVLLAVLMVMLGSGVSLVSHRLDNSTERRERSEIVALAQNYLREALSQAIPVAIANDANTAVIDFQGSAGDLGFVTHAPVSAPLGGMIRLDLRFESRKHGADGALILGWRPYRDLPADETRAGTRPLLTGIGSIAFAYYDPGAPDRPAGWRGEWQDQPTLPTLVRMFATFSDGEAMPDLVVALRLASPAAAAASPPPGAPQKTQ